MIIFKYPVPVEDNFFIQMPLGAQILSFQAQDNSLCLWASVCPEAPLEDRKFSIIGTGHDIDMDLVKKFLGTVQIMNGMLVWHLFELK